MEAPDESGAWRIRSRLKGLLSEGVPSVCIRYWSFPRTWRSSRCRQSCTLHPGQGGAASSAIQEAERTLFQTRVFLKIPSQSDPHVVRSSDIRIEVLFLELQL